jgi:SAM-dependent methyltransferase
MTSVCRYCEDTKSQVIRYANFKHFWHRCSACGTMWRQGKDRLPGSTFLSIIEKIPLLSKIVRKLLPEYVKRQNLEVATYENYGAAFHRIFDPSPGLEMFEVKRKRYLAEASDFLSLIIKHRLDVAEMSLLDVSGGPGTFAHFIHGSVGKVAVSEYSAETVNAMRSYLTGMRVLQADINKPWPENDTYDAILYRSCLYFCNDFKTHLKDIHQRIRPGGLIYICTTAPSLGNSLRWQYEDYTHNVLYSEKTVTDTLENEGFSILDRGTTEFYPHFLDHYDLRDRIFHSWGVWNGLRKNGPKGLDAKAFWILAKRSI